MKNIIITGAAQGIGYVHNACRCTFDSFCNIDEDTFRDVFNVNYFGALYLAQAVLPYMVQQKRGKVIFTSSGVGVTGLKIGIGLAKNIKKKSFIICHSLGQKIQTIGCYLFPVKMGKLLSKLTANYAGELEKTGGFPGK